MYPSRAGSNYFTVIGFAGRPKAGKVSFRRIGGTFIPSVQGWEMFMNTETRIDVILLKFCLTYISDCLMHGKHEEY
jgi:hypothetical protein